MTIKVFSLSDLHIDYRGNFDHLLQLEHRDYAAASLIVPGDATDNLDKLTQLLSHFKRIFAEVFFVPGNHELWVRDGKNPDSIAKFAAIQQLCQRIGVHTSPVKLGTDNNALWIVPLFSWYTKAEEGNDSLYRSKPSQAPGEDQTDKIWSDNMLCRWDSLPHGQRPVDYFLALNQTNVDRQYDAPVISFSHFLPLSELIYPLNWVPRKDFSDPVPQFNFSEVAGTSLLAEQITTLGSIIHIHGHQHRNRHRDINGITYISHCLGYPKERKSPSWRGDNLPKLIWDDGPVPTAEAF